MLNLYIVEWYGKLYCMIKPWESQLENGLYSVDNIYIYIAIWALGEPCYV